MRLGGLVVVVAVADLSAVGEGHEPPQVVERFATVMATPPSRKGGVGVGGRPPPVNNTEHRRKPTLISSVGDGVAGFRAAGDGRDVGEPGDARGHQVGAVGAVAQLAEVSLD